MLKDTGKDAINIVVCSGKGGTGKTTFALSLAWTLGHSSKFDMPVKLIDCDVEEPNCHLFLDCDYSSPEPVEAVKPHFDSTCTGCGRCAKACRYNAIAIVNKSPIVFEDMCHSCGLCEFICPEKSISMKPLVIGEMLVAKNNKYFDFAYGKLNVGAVQTPDVITKLHSLALSKGINIYDGPPGTACNAYKAMSLADNLILVAEPTPFGANDLSLALNLAAHLKKPTSVVINKFEANNRIIEDLCQKHSVPVVGRIPFDIDYAKACSSGKVLAELYPELREEVIRAFSDSLTQSVVPQEIQNNRISSSGQTLKKDFSSSNSASFEEIAILSGKGGTGKTMITAAFVSMADNFSAADCDVDAANLSLVFKGELTHSQPVNMSLKALIDADKCIKCGRCQEVCKFDAVLYFTNTKTYFVDEYSCEGCGYCVEACPNNSISEIVAKTGQMMCSEKGRASLAHAELVTGSENTGKLVSNVREFAYQIANYNNSSLLLLDGPPGIGCPAIATITGVDRVILVTEPTVAALHDLARVLKLVKQFGITSEIIINKSDLNKEMTANICEFAYKNSVEIIGTVPFDPTVKDSLKAGVAITDYNQGPASLALKEIWTKLKEKKK